MKTSRYNQNYYTTPHYATSDAPSGVFTVRLMPAIARSAPLRSQRDGVRHRFGRSALARMRLRSNVS